MKLSVLFTFFSKRRFEKFNKVNICNDCCVSLTWFHFSIQRETKIQGRGGKFISFKKQRQCFTEVKVLLLSFTCNGGMLDHKQSSKKRNIMLKMKTFETKVQKQVKLLIVEYSWTADTVIPSAVQARLNSKVLYTNYMYILGIKYFMY